MKQTCQCTNRECASVERHATHLICGADLRVGDSDHGINVCERCSIGMAIIEVDVADPEIARDRIEASVPGYVMSPEMALNAEDAWKVAEFARRVLSAFNARVILRDRRAR